MNRNQKIALGCGGAGCLGLIVVAVAAGLVYYYSRGFSLIPGENRNGNYNSNRNSNSAESSAEEGATSMSDDEKHKFFMLRLLRETLKLCKEFGESLG